MIRRRLRRPGRSSSAAEDRFPPASYGRLVLRARDDPITGMIAWPDFYDQLPGLLEQVIISGGSFGLAIGDVDNLKSYVEESKSVDPASFGHLAGNQLMNRLGFVARRWLGTSGPFDGCLATFGGDEVIMVAIVDDESSFLDSVTRLRDALCASLPRTVSFAAGVVSPQDRLGDGDRYWSELTMHLLGAVERALFSYKREHHRGPGTSPQGFVVPVNVMAGLASAARPDELPTGM